MRSAARSTSLRTGQNGGPLACRAASGPIDAVRMAAPIVRMGGEAVGRARPEVPSARCGAEQRRREDVLGPAGVRAVAGVPVCRSEGPTAAANGHGRIVVGLRTSTELVPAALSKWTVSATISVAADRERAITSTGDALRLGRADRPPVPAGSAPPEGSCAGSPETQA